MKSIRSTTIEIELFETGERRREGPTLPGSRTLATRHELSGNASPCDALTRTEHLPYTRPVLPDVSARAHERPPLRLPALLPYRGGLRR